jgi:hypothetical protein
MVGVAVVGATVGCAVTFAAAATSVVGALEEEEENRLETNECQTRTERGESAGGET